MSQAASTPSANSRTYADSVSKATGADLRRFLLVSGGAALLALLVALPTVNPIAESAPDGRPQNILGLYGPESPRMREQLWIVPGADAHIPRARG